MSSEGHVVIPKEIRDMLNIQYGDSFTVEVIDDKIIISLSQYNKKLNDFRLKIKTELKSKKIRVSDKEIQLAKEKIWL
jgi:AbrB family looped-hinge helix DNA binding protein